MQYVHHSIILQQLTNLCEANYLIHPPNSSVPARPGAGIAIIVIYFVLLFPAAICYFRILLTIATNPGYTPTGMPTQAVKKRWEPEQRNDVFEASCASTTVAEKTDSRSESSSKASKKRGMQEFGQTIMQLDMEAVFSGDVPPPPGLEQFYTKEAFACDPSGLPRWCGICCNWKPDRSHHCTDVGRCVRKLDHFCPW